jgi:hypothetical protein
MEDFEILGRIEEVKTIAVGPRIHEIVPYEKPSARGAGGKLKALPLSGWRMVQFIASSCIGTRRMG